MEFSEEHPMDKNFVFNLRKMICKKSEPYHDEFFRRIHLINYYLNEAGSTFNDLDVSAGIALQMDLENKWGKEEGNI